MGIDGWLVLNIALGIVVGSLLTRMLRGWWNKRRATPSKPVDEKVASEHAATERRAADEKTAAAKVADKKAVEDWNFLWDNAPESAKEQIRKFVEDEQLRKQAEELDLFHFLWYSSSEETRGQLRFRWKLEKIPPRIREYSDDNSTL
jgi:hypothetical protein